MGFERRRLRYVAEGSGAYHWIADTDEATRWFVTCDDLETKPWPRNDPNTVFDGLLVAYRAAMDLRESGLGFVIAPVESLSGAAAERVDDRHSVSLFEYIAGEAGHWGHPLTPDVVGDVVPMLAELHRSTAVVHHVVRAGSMCQVATDSKKHAPSSIAGGMAGRTPNRPGWS